MTGFFCETGSIVIEVLALVRLQHDHSGATPEDWTRPVPIVEAVLIFAGCQFGDFHEFQRGYDRLCLSW
jgi:hypothetical protein